jgi:Ca2+:H+ antiporter
METGFRVMLVFVPLALIAGWLGAGPVWLFALSALAIVPLARYIGVATEELSAHTGAGVSGLLNATFGNATELIIGLFALHAGLIEVVKASITGSVLGNLLLVVGTAMFAGGITFKKQSFNATAAAAAGSSLLLAAIALVTPALFLFTATLARGAAVEDLSIIIAFLLILSYAASLIFSLHTHKHLYSEEAAAFEPTWSPRTSILVLLGATLLVALMSDTLVNAIEPLVASLGWSQLFIGVVVIAIIGNVAEHASAVMIALKDRMDLALQISIGSATQVVMLVAPVLVIASVLMGRPMSLVFNLFEIASLVFSVFIVNAITVDGESNWFEGVQLLVAYLMIAVAFFFYP